MNEDFYLTLLSNSSLTYFPYNKTTTFTTQLPKTINLIGDWYVALVEIQYPCSMPSVQEHENLIYVDSLVDQKYVSENIDKKNIFYDISNKTYISKEKYRIKSGNYITTSELINAINKSVDKQVKFEYDDIHTERIKFTKLDNIEAIYFSPKLSLQLGYEPETDICVHPEPLYPVNILLGIPSQFFIYTDIIEPQLVGDVEASLLRIVNIDVGSYIYGGHEVRTYNSPHYSRVLRRNFDNIHIDIRTDTGSYVPFLYGTCSVKLHFKKK